MNKYIGRISKLISEDINSGTELSDGDAVFDYFKNLQNSNRIKIKHNIVPNYDGDELFGFSGQIMTTFSIPSTWIHESNPAESENVDDVDIFDVDVTAYRPKTTKDIQIQFLVDGEPTSENLSFILNESEFIDILKKDIIGDLRLYNQRFDMALDRHYGLNIKLVIDNIKMEQNGDVTSIRVYFGMEIRVLD